MRRIYTMYIPVDFKDGGAILNGKQIYQKRQL